MKFSVQSFLLFLLWVSMNSCSPPDKSNSAFNEEMESAKLRHIKETLWPKAYSSHDTLLLEKILHEDFELIDGSGEVTDKAFELNWVKNNKTSNDSFWYEIKRLEFYHGNTAIVSGTGHMINDGQKAIYQSSNIFVRTDSLWQAISSHVSGYQEVE